MQESKVSWKRIKAAAQRPENHSRNMFVFRYKTQSEAKRAAKRARERYGVNAEVQGFGVYVRGMIPKWEEPKAKEVDAPRKERRWGYDDLAITCKARPGDRIKVGLYSSRESARKIGNNLKRKYNLSFKLTDVGKACELQVYYPWKDKEVEDLKKFLPLKTLSEEEHKVYIRLIGEEEELGELYIRAEIGERSAEIRKTHLDDWDNSPAEAHSQPGVWVYVDTFINTQAAKRIGRKMRIDHGLQHRVGAGKLLFVRDNTDEIEELKGYLPRS